MKLAREPILLKLALEIKNVEADVVKYIDYYNARRIHQKPGQRTPIKVEEDFLHRNEMNSCPNTVN